MNLLQQYQRLLALAQSGLKFGKDCYDQERYRELEQMSYQLLANLSETPIEKIQNLYAHETGYPTPKVDVRGFCLNEQQEILLIQDAATHEWSLPGGFGEVGFTPKENIEKELWEETGFQVKVTELLAVFDTNLNQDVPQSFQYYKLVFAYQLLEGRFQPNIEVAQMAYFPIDALPPLSKKRTTKEQLVTLLQHRNKTYFD